MVPISQTNFPFILLPLGVAKNVNFTIYLRPIFTFLHFLFLVIEKVNIELQPGSHTNPVCVCFTFKHEYVDVEFVPKS